MALFRIAVNPQGEITRLATPEQNLMASIKVYYASVPVCSRCRRKKLKTKRRREVHPELVEGWGFARGVRRRAAMRRIERIVSIS